MRQELPGATHAGFLATKVFGSLDGLRAIAILAVLWHHSGAEEWRLRIADRGFLGVDLFFVISGFLITTLMLREQSATGTVSLKGFYWRRALRILPPYLLFLGILVALAFLKPGRIADETFAGLPWAFFYLSNFVPLAGILSITWSLSAEEQFYLVVPTLQKCCARAMPFLLPVLYVLAALPTFGLFPSLDLPQFFRGATFGPILLGVMLAQVLHHPRGFRLIASLLGSRFAGPVALVLVLLAASHPADDISGWPRIADHWCFAALIASCVVREDNGLRPLLTLWPSRRIGAVSYGIYLYHLLVLHFATAALAKVGLASQAPTFLVLTVGTWLVSEASYRLYESRFLALRKRVR